MENSVIVFIGFCTVLNVALNMMMLLTIRQINEELQKTKNEVFFYKEALYKLRRSVERSEKCR